MIVLDRFASCSMGTFGRLYYPGGECVTVERPWKQNEANVSCIPAGRYPIERDTFQGRYPNFALRDVPGRSAIEIHVANTASEVKGCIGLGMELGVLNGLWCVRASQTAFERFMASMEGIDWDTIEVRWKRDPEGG